MEKVMKVRQILKSSDNQFIYNVMSNNDVDNMCSFRFKALCIKTKNGLKDCERNTIGFSAYVVLNLAVQILLGGRHNV